MKDDETIEYIGGGGSILVAKKQILVNSSNQQTRHRIPVEPEPIAQSVAEDSGVTTIVRF